MVLCNCGDGREGGCGFGDHDGHGRVLHVHGRVLHVHGRDHGRHGSDHDHGERDQTLSCR